jgi:polypeptide N-acetylgalactosaminyltransferase
MQALLHFTPDSLVEQYIWLSDGNADSKEKELKAMSPKVEVHAFKERQGLIRAKMKGVAMATAPVLVFMEAHCIVNKHWLQHILVRVVENPKVLAQPSLDHIPQDDWTGYYPVDKGHWRYEWNFNLIYTNPGKVHNDVFEPYASPGTSGGIFAMRKDWFEELGLFDTGMHQWGGDHMELTMKVWRCGGRIELVPCSRIGHLYRDPAHRPYDVEVNTVVHNYKRLAELWTKDHLDIFYKMKPEAVNMKLVGMEQVQSQYAELEEKLQCKNMSWYLDNIDHEMKWEMKHVCHPYAGKKDPIRCKGGAKNLVPGRWTITKEMPAEEYFKARDDALARAATDAPQLLLRRPASDEL